MLKKFATRRRSWGCISPPVELLQTSPFSKILRGHVRTAPGNMHVKFEVAEVAACCYFWDHLYLLLLYMNTFQKFLVLFDLMRVRPDGDRFRNRYILASRTCSVGTSGHFLVNEDFPNEMGTYGHLGRRFPASRRHPLLKLLVTPSTSGVWPSV